MVDFHDVYDVDYNEEFMKFLYELLGERKDYMNISHKEMPTYEQHVHFVMTKPYKGWYVISYGEELIGSVYLSKDDSVGIFIKDKCIGMGVGTAALKFIYKTFDEVETIYANIAPLNSGSIAFFVNMGFKYFSMMKDDKGHIIQYTYEIANPENFYATVDALSPL